MENEVKVLDKGFVSFVEHMGGDRGVVQAARVSYRSDGMKTPEEDKKLIHYLLAHDHGTPFEHAVLKFHVKAPIFVARQWFRHRMASYNEVSGRYTELRDEFYTPAAWRAQDASNKQGSHAAAGLGIPENELYTHQADAMKLYRRLLERGVAKEMARLVLPVNLYTEFYWTVNARSLMNFIKLRSENHAQFEIRKYSNVILAMFSGIMPWTAEAFMSTLKISQYAAEP